MPLLSAMWVCGVLIAFAASFELSSRAAALTAAATLRSLQIDAAVDGAVHNAVIELLAGASVEQAVSRSRTRSSGPVDLSIRPERGRIDLNQAPITLLTAVFRGSGLSDEQAESVVTQIMRRREMQLATSMLSPDGEAAVQNFQFRRTSELLLLTGMTQATFQRVRDAITVYSGLSQPDYTLAPALVRATLASLQGANVFYFGNVAETAAQKKPQHLVGEAFELRIRIARDQHAIVRTVVVRIIGTSQQPFWTLSDGSDVQ